ncbi:UDP-glucose 4-epimerase GalE [Rugosimonospora acidiphila]|uniref:UDP-glucose 4-epimerase n=1 Tax=Rugosimonospora acidiphila TaxID=556531 RepID=A0ABP9SDS4_9ACTN
MTAELAPAVPARAGRRMTVLVTGGAGFVGSHVCVALLERGHEVVVVDNYTNSSPLALTRVEKLAGRPLVAAHGVDLRDRPALSAVFRRYPIDAVMHLAARKAVAESWEMPTEYLDNNIGGITGLLRAMSERGVPRLVFSSSCSIYGDVDAVPVAEDCAARPANPYAVSKWMCEQILVEACRSSAGLTVSALRYFNPIGAHESGLLGEAPRGVAGNVMPNLMRVAVGRADRVSVYGADYPTVDGTPVRDYIHVMDVAEAHCVALEHLDRTGGGVRVVNLGTGVGTSVLELIDAFGVACGRPIPYTIGSRRNGDVTALVADPRRAAREWNWRTTRDLAAMCRDAWRFQRLHPTGYGAGTVPAASAVPAAPAVPAASSVPAGPAEPR